MALEKNAVWKHFTFISKILTVDSRTQQDVQKIRGQPTQLIRKLFMPYIVTEMFLQPNCTWFSVSAKLRFDCKRIVYLPIPFAAPFACLRGFLPFYVYILFK